jgi:hypothetical protein
MSRCGFPGRGSAAEGGIDSIRDYGDTTLLIATYSTGTLFDLLSFPEARVAVPQLNVARNDDFAGLDATNMIIG